MFHAIDKKLDSHITETKAYREGEAKKNQEHHTTLYLRPGGIIYEVESLKESVKQNAKHKAWMLTLFGIPIFGWLIEAALQKLSK